LSRRKIVDLLVENPLPARCEQRQMFRIVLGSMSYYLVH